jgi:prepilin-type N-terminal cleavage/methylation domain-containing protein
MKKIKLNQRRCSRLDGFTLVEIMVVVVVLALAMWAAVPLFSGGAQLQAQSAANMIAADLEYAKSMAISHQQKYGVVFDTAADTYQVVDQNGVVLPHPVKIGFQYTVDFHSDSRLKQVDLVTANFDGTSKISFDYLGSPYSGSGSGSAMNSGTITLQGGGTTMTIIVEPVTGYIRIQ